MTPKDVPDGMTLLNKSAKMLALLYANSPDEKALFHLDSLIGRLEGDVIEAVGADEAPIILNAFRRTVLSRKREIETASSGSLSQFLDVLSSDDDRPRDRPARTVF
jgi:hypothetical protein